MITPDQLQQQFGIHGVVRFDTGNGGLSRIMIETAHATAEVYLLGAHIARFATGGREILFVSSASNWAIGKAIRGGVPICFPWFGARAGHPQAPMHGFARLREWQMESVARKGDDIELVLKLSADEQTRELWDAEFVLRHRITVGTKLTMELEMQNRGSEAIHFEEALHTYFACDDIRAVSVVGLDNMAYIDKADGAKRKTQDPAPIRFTGETDRVYLATQAATRIDGVRPGKAILVAKSSSDATVVWNPWIAKAKALADFGDDEWTRMLCVETCNVGPHGVKLEAGQTHRMRATLVIE